MPAAVDPSARSTSTSIPTFSPTKGSTALTQGMDRRASHFALHHSCAEPGHALLLPRLAVLPVPTLRAALAALLVVAMYWLMGPGKACMLAAQNNAPQPVWRPHNRSSMRA